MAAPDDDFEPAAQVRTIFESASEFGLQAEEILDAVVATLERMPDDVKAHYVDGLSAALAARLLDKERRSLLDNPHALPSGKQDRKKKMSRAELEEQRGI